MSEEAGSGALRPALGMLADRLRAVPVRLQIAGLVAGLLGSTVLLELGVHWWMPGMLLVSLAGAALWALVDRALTQLRTRPAPPEPVELVYRGMRWIAAAMCVIALAAFLAGAVHIMFGGGWN